MLNVRFVKRRNETVRWFCDVIVVVIDVIGALRRFRCCVQVKRRKHQSVNVVVVP